MLRASRHAGYVQALLTREDSCRFTKKTQFRPIWPRLPLMSITKAMSMLGALQKEQYMKTSSCFARNLKKAANDIQTYCDFLIMSIQYPHENICMQHTNISCKQYVFTYILHACHTCEIRCICNISSLLMCIT